MNTNEGKVLWITGLSGAGKTTLATKIVTQLHAMGKHVIFLDGDELRWVFDVAMDDVCNYDRDKRLMLAMRYARLCKMLACQGVIVVVATISLFKEVHIWNRKNLPGYFEVYLKVPLDELRYRDPKGIYRRFDAGELTNVAGLDLPIDEPERPDCTISFSSVQTVENVIHKLLKKLGVEQ